MAVHNYEHHTISGVHACTINWDAMSMKSIFPTIMCSIFKSAQSVHLCDIIIKLYFLNRTLFDNAGYSNGKRLHIFQLFPVNVLYLPPLNSSWHKMHAAMKIWWNE